MKKLPDILLVFFLIGMLAVIILTWGSIGSAVLTLGLLLCGGFIALRKFMDTHDPSDLWMDE